MELGTGYGISGLYMIAALKLNQKGFFYTIDGSPGCMAIATELFYKLDPSCWKTFLGTFQKVLPDVLEEIRKLDLVFVDGDHSYDATLRYFQTILPYITPRGIMIFDDVVWSAEMQRAWMEISRNPGFRRCVRVRDLGFCLKM